MEEVLKLEGNFTLNLFRNGKKIDERTLKNLITNAGKAELANLLGNVSSPVAFTYLAVGTGTTAADVTDTTLEAEIVDTGLARASATVTRVTTTVTNDTTQLLKAWTATGVKAVTEIGAFNDASAGILLGHQVFAAMNVISSDVLELTYKFKNA